MDLLQATGEVVNGMDDVHFNMKDVIYIVMLLVSALGGWFTLKGSVDKLNQQMKVVDKHIDVCQQDAKEEIIATKHSRSALRKQLQEELKEQSDLVNKRIDIVKNDLKEFQKESASEIKVLNDQITAIKTDTSEIKGMVQMLITKSGNKL